jgi:zinc protease
MLGGGFLNSHLASRIRVKDGLSYSVGSIVSAKSFEKDGLFRVYAIAAPQNVAKVESAFKEELDKALKDGFTAAELDADEAGWLQSRQVQRSEDGALAEVLAARDYDGRTLAWDGELENKVRALKVDEVHAALRHEIDPAGISIFKAGDFKKAATAAAGTK